MSFAPPTDHGDAVIREIQDWLADHASVGSPLEETTFKRRFKHATAYSPLTYVQHLRVEETKRRLERADTPIDEISWQVGYENPAFFRQLFKRTTRLTPGEYRRKFRLPEVARVEGSPRIGSAGPLPYSSHQARGQSQGVSPRCSKRLLARKMGLIAPEPPNPPLTAVVHCTYGLVQGCTFAYLPLTGRISRRVLP